MAAAATKEATEDRRKVAAGLLADGKGVKEVAVEMGVHRVQIWRWMQDPEVAAYYLVAVNTRAGSLAKQAIDCLGSLLDDPDCPHAVKVAAAKLLLDRADKLIGQRDERIIELRPVNDNGEEPKWKQEGPWAFMEKKK